MATMAKKSGGVALRIAALGAALAVATIPLFSAATSATATKTTTTTATATAPAYTGESIVFTATVTHNALVPMGTVTFAITGADSSTPGCDGSNVVTLAPNGSGAGAIAQCTISAGLFAAASPYAVTESYSGDDTFVPSVGTQSKVIHAGPTTITISSASNPTVTGQPASFSATLAPASPAAGLPTGSVAFSVAGTDSSTVGCDGGDTISLSGGVATCPLSAGLLAAGSPFVVTATYSGDPNFAASTTSTTQTVKRATATIGVTSSVAAPVSGQPISFTASVTGVAPPGSGTPNGSILFSVVGSNGTPRTCDGGNTVALSGSSASCNFSTGLAAKPLSYTVSASLVDANFKSAVAGSVVQPISKAMSATTVSDLPGSLVASQAFTFKVVVATSSPGTGVPMSQLEWAICPNLETCTSDTGTKGGTFQLPAPTAGDIANNRSRAFISMPGGIAPGFYDVYANYVGDANIRSSASAVGHILVNPIPTTAAVILNRNPVLSDGRLVISAAINVDPRASGSLGAPSGTVTFTITGTSSDMLMCEVGSNAIGVSTTSANQGVAKCVIAAGQLTGADAPYQIKAMYSGDPNYAGSTGFATSNVQG
jgi:hypothetical protein